MKIIITVWLLISLSHLYFTSSLLRMVAKYIILNSYWFILIKMKSDIKQTNKRINKNKQTVSKQLFI